MLELFPMIYCAWCYSRRRYLPATDEGSHNGRRPTSTDLWFPWSDQCYGNGPGHAYFLPYTGICLYMIMKQNTEDSSSGLSDSSDNILSMRCGATGQPRLSAIVQERRLSLFGHISRIPDETDASSIITAPPFSPSENWRRPPGRPQTTWMKTIQQDLRSNNLSLDEAITLAQNRPLWRLMSAFGATHP